MNIKQQYGVGLVEVLVSLILLAIGVLGFTGLQLKAIDASAEASQQVLALTVARDLAERMRANPQAVITGQYKVGFVEGATPDKNCMKTAFPPKDIAEKCDLPFAAKQAQDNGMNLAVDRCPTSASRQCIYVAWGQTSLADQKNDEGKATQKGLGNCIQMDGENYKSAYAAQSHCLYLEAY